MYENSSSGITPYVWLSDLKNDRGYYEAVEYFEKDRPYFQTWSLQYSAVTPSITFVIDGEEYSQSSLYYHYFYTGIEFSQVIEAGKQVVWTTQTNGVQHTDTFVTDGVSTVYSLPNNYSYSVGLTVDGVAIPCLYFANWQVGSGDGFIPQGTVEVHYLTASNETKAFSFGYIDSTSTIGAMSLCIGTNNVASRGHTTAIGVECEASSLGATAIGRYSKATGQYALAYGYYARANYDYASAIGLYNIAEGRAQTVIGKYNVPDNSNLFIIGNGTGTSTRSNALFVSATGNMTIAGTLTQGSDRRLKEHIDYLGDEAVEFVRSLKPAHYIKDNEHHVGFYAQDVEEADKWDCMTGEMNGYKTLGYMELIAPLVAYVQKLEKRIEELERRK
jgi:hypothetical protein